jgi:hypothetical protein
VLQPAIDQWAALAILGGLALWTAYAIAAWRGVIFRGWIERRLKTGMLFNSQLATVGALWLVMGLDILLGGEALLRLIGVGTEIEVAAEPYLGVPALVPWTIYFLSWWGRPAWTRPRWYRDALARPGSTVIG